MRKLHKLFRTYLYILPILNFLLTFTVYFININITDWVFVGNLGGYSIITSLAYVGFFCFSPKYCMFTKLCSISTLIISVFNTLASKLVSNIEQYNTYETYFSKIIVSTTIILTISLYLIKCKRQS